MKHDPPRGMMVVFFQLLCSWRQAKVSSLCSGDEYLQDVVCNSFWLRLGRHPAGLHSGLHAAFPMRLYGSDWTHHHEEDAVASLSDCRSSLLRYTPSSSLVSSVVSFLTPLRVTLATTWTSTSPSSLCCSSSSTQAGWRSDDLFWIFSSQSKVIEKM